MLVSSLLKLIAKIAALKIKTWSLKPVQTQQKQFKHLINSAKRTSFGIDHNFQEITSYKDFVKNVPIREYEGIRPYIERLKKGERNILWPGKPIYFALTSGTTSGAKYIPITKESLNNHLNGAKNAILNYVAQTGKTNFIKGKFIFIQGSPLLDKVSEILIGRLSGISAHHIPFYMQSKMLPSWETNIIDDWERKVEQIVDETIDEDMTIISGIPSWVQIYFEKIVEKKQKKVGTIFQNFNLFIYGGVNYKPYEKKFKSLIGRNIDSIELFPASEGFYAFQDRQESKELLLILNDGIFYEFIEEKKYHSNIFDRIPIAEVCLNTNYVLIVSTNAGLWAYDTGDTIKFTSLNPHRVIVTGRVAQFLSAFGEHVIVMEVERAIEKACIKTGIIVNEFTVAPKFKKGNEMACHEWFIEFAQENPDIQAFQSTIDLELQKQNKYYNDLVSGKIIASAKVKMIKKGGFNKYMKSIGKLGGQNKIPKISNNRKVADQLNKLNLVTVN
tara:strand:+ start:11161 stop:12663 length:1503 start_codon:yes stop_codon:yes gene_type:complete